MDSPGQTAVPSQPFSTSSVKSLVSGSIASGGYAYDKSYTEICEAIYVSAMQLIVTTSSDVGSEMKRLACAGLQVGHCRIPQLVTVTLRVLLHFPTPACLP